jgi:hypothetical protein
VTTSAPEATPVVRAMWFPCQVTLPDGAVVRWAKVAVTAERVYVFTQTSSREVVTSYEAPITDSTIPTPLSPRSDPIRATTADGELLARKLPGCGCSSAVLKSYQPFTPMRYGVAS